MLMPTMDELRAEQDQWRASKPTAQRKRTKRQKDQLARGIHPASKAGLLPDSDKTCGDCEYAVRLSGENRYYWKCRLVVITRGPGTDIRISWPACTAFKERNDDEESNMA